MKHSWGLGFLRLTEANHTRPRLVHTERHSLARFCGPVASLPQIARYGSVTRMCQSGGAPPINHFDHPQLFFRLIPDAIGNPALLSESERDRCWVRASGRVDT